MVREVRRASGFYQMYSSADHREGNAPILIWEGRTRPLVIDDELDLVINNANMFLWALDNRSQAREQASSSNQGSKILTTLPVVFVGYLSQKFGNFKGMMYVNSLITACIDSCRRCVLRDTVRVTRLHINDAVRAQVG